MRKGPRKPTCSHGTEHWTPGGHCRVCDRAYRERAFERRAERLRQARESAALRGQSNAAKWNGESREADRTNRIVELMEAHWRAGTPWERAAIDEEIRKLSVQG